MRAPSGRTPHPSWPKQLMLPGQAAAPEGPVDMAAMYVMHHGFRRDLDDFVAAAGATPVSDRTAWKALGLRWEVFAEVLHHHHSGEDAGLWPILLDRAYADEAETLHAMEAEHAEIDPLLESCAAGFRRLAEHADDDARAALAVRLTATRERLGQHLRHEETDAIALIQRHVTSEEWEQLEEEHFRKGLTLGQAIRTVPWAGYGLSAETRTHVLAGTNAAFRLIYRLTWRGFARRHAVAFRHLFD